MKHSTKRNAFLKYHLFAKDGDGEGGGISSGENNKPTNGDEHINLWDTEMEDEDVTPPGKQTQQTGTELSATEIFNKHVESLGFGAHAEALMNALDKRDPEAFAKIVTQMNTDVYKATMIDANKLLKDGTKNLQMQLQDSTAKTFESTKLIETLHKDVPFTKDPDFAPVAKAILNEYLAKKVKGKPISPERALKETKAYFERLGNALGKSSNSNEEGTQNRKGKSEEVDFVALFGGTKSK